MENRNLRLALTVGTTYLAATLGATGILAWIVSQLSPDGSVSFINTAYISVLAIGMLISIVGGYAFNTYLTRDILRYSQSNPDIPEDLVRPICKGRILSRWYGYVSAVCLSTAALIFGFTGETYIELLCLLMAIGFTALFFSRHYRSISRQILRQRFRLT